MNLHVAFLYNENFYDIVLPRTGKSSEFEYCNKLEVPRGASMTCRLFLHIDKPSICILNQTVVFPKFLELKATNQGPRIHVISHPAAFPSFMN